MTTTPSPEPMPLGLERYGDYNIHSAATCIPPCPFHSPSEHPLKNAQMHIRNDKSMLVERICEHGVGHSDPDSVAYMEAHGIKGMGVHGCDGCCSGKESPEPMPEGEAFEHYRLEGAAWILSKLLEHPHEDIDHLMVEQAYKQTYDRLGATIHPTPPTNPQPSEFETALRDIWEEVHELGNPGNENEDEWNKVVELGLEHTGTLFAAHRQSTDSPMGVTNWIEHGKKYGYFDFVKDLPVDMPASPQPSELETVVRYNVKNYRLDSQTIDQKVKHIMDAYAADRERLRKELLAGVGEDAVSHELVCPTMIEFKNQGEWTDPISVFEYMCTCGAGEATQERRRVRDIIAQVFGAK